MENNPIETDEDQSKRGLEKPYRFKCLKCGKCCSDPNTLVNLTFSDILRIQKYMGYSLSELMDVIGFYIFETEPDEAQKKAMVVPPIMTQRGNAYVGLKKSKEGKCQFLDENSLCKIYTVRPNICRTFPFHFHTKPIEKPSPRMEINMQYAAKAIEYCPGIGQPYPVVDPKNWLIIGEETVKNILAEVVLINKWNEAVKNNKIDALAENYIRTIFELDKKSKGTEKKATGKKKYQQHLKQKLNDSDERAEK